MIENHSLFTGCYNKSPSNYNGTWSTTITESKCARWDSPLVQNMNYTSYWPADESTYEQHNYCRGVWKQNALANNNKSLDSFNSKDIWTYTAHCSTNVYNNTQRILSFYSMKLLCKLQVSRRSPSS